MTRDAPEWRVALDFEQITADARELVEEMRAAAGEFDGERVERVEAACVAVERCLPVESVVDCRVLEAVLGRVFGE